MLGLLTVGHDVMEGWKPGCCLVRAQMFLLNQSKHLTWAHEGLYTAPTPSAPLTANWGLNPSSVPTYICSCSSLKASSCSMVTFYQRHNVILVCCCETFGEGTKEVTWFICVRERPCIPDLPSPKNARLSSVHFPKKQEHLNYFKRDYFIGWPSVQN